MRTIADRCDGTMNLNPNPDCDDAVSENENDRHRVHAKQNDVDDDWDRIRDRLADDAILRHQLDDAIR